MSLQAGDLSLMAALLNDADTRARILAHNAAEQAASDAWARAKLARQDADQRYADAEAVLVKANERAAALDDWERRLGEVNTAVNADKQSWEAIRQTVDGEQADRAADLSRREDAVNQREFIVGRREKDCASREAVTGALQISLERKHDRLDRALNLNRPFDDGAPTPAAEAA